MASSPFPGMNPHLEAPGIRESFHHSLIVYTAAALNRVLPASYVAIVDAPMIVEALEEPHQRFVNIVRAQDAGEVIATLEILSHAIKPPGRDRDAYLRKQRAICLSNTLLVEIDLLRAGSPTRAIPLERLDATPYDYLICLHRGGRGMRYELWPATVRQPLPRISVPLEAEVPDVVLDMQAVLDRAYDEGAFSRLLDCRKEPVPRLIPANAIWADALLKSQGLR